MMLQVGYGMLLDGGETAQFGPNQDRLRIAKIVLEH